MKKEELIALGVDEEVAKKIMAINGTDIENAKAKAGQATEKLTQELENANSKLQEKDKLLEEANVQIENFKGMDVEGIKKAADEYKAKYEQSAAEAKTKEEEYQQKLTEQAYEFKLNETVSSLKFPNELTKSAFMNELKAKKLPLEGEKLLGFEDYIKEVGEKNPGLFVTEEATKETTPEVVIKGTQGQPLSNNPMAFNFTPIHNKPTN
jgi:hypothetical protein